MSWKERLIAAIGGAAVALAVPLVQKYEGTVLRSYRDPVNVLTSCTGQTFTREQCEEMLYKDLAKHADALSCVRAPLTDAQRAAFLSFAFNVGDDAFCRSTLVRKANAGDMDGACAELSRWTYAGGKQLPGLVKRRAAERQLCERGLA